MVKPSIGAAKRPQSAPPVEKRPLQGGESDADERGEDGRNPPSESPSPTSKKVAKRDGVIENHARKLGSDEAPSNSNDTGAELPLQTTPTARPTRRALGRVQYTEPEDSSEEEGKKVEESESSDEDYDYEGKKLCKRVNDSAGDSAGRDPSRGMKKRKTKKGRETNGSAKKGQSTCEEHLNILEACPRPGIAEDWDLNSQRISFEAFMLRDFIPPSQLKKEDTYHLLWKLEDHLAKMTMLMGADHELLRPFMFMRFLFQKDMMVEQARRKERGEPPLKQYPHPEGFRGFKEFDKLYGLPACSAVDLKDNFFFHPILIIDDGNMAKRRSRMALSWRRYELPLPRGHVKVISVAEFMASHDKDILLQKPSFGLEDYPPDDDPNFLRRNHPLDEHYEQSKELCFKHVLPPTEMRALATIDPSKMKNRFPTGKKLKDLLPEFFNEFVIYYEAEKEAFKQANAKFRGPRRLDEIERRITVSRFLHHRFGRYTELCVKNKQAKAEQKKELEKEKKVKSNEKRRERGMAKKNGVQ